jgi:hypothetical protein
MPAVGITIELALTPTGSFTPLPKSPIHQNTGRDFSNNFYEDEDIQGNINIIYVGNRLLKEDYRFEYLSDSELATIMQWSNRAIMSYLRIKKADGTTVMWQGWVHLRTSQQGIHPTDLRHYCTLTIKQVQ